MINSCSAGLQFLNTNHVMLGIELVMPTEFRGTGTLTASLLASIHECDCCILLLRGLRYN